MSKHCITVSPEMLAFVGHGPVTPGDWPERPVVLMFCDRGAPTVSIDPDPFPAQISDQADLVFVVTGLALVRLFGGVPHAGSWYLSEPLRVLVAAIGAADADLAVRDTLRLARSIELLCAVVPAIAAGVLTATDGDAGLNEADARRLAQAQRMIAERWHEKLTLAAIARSCGLNRGKLTRGFRLMYGCTVADALTEQRLASARQMLRTTDLPVSAIGYRCGYLNNASFTRAFSRHVGEAPTRWRASRAHAA